MNNYKIIIDPGHGGTDNGASGNDSNVIVLTNHINAEDVLDNLIVH